MPWISNLLPFAKLKTARNVRLGEPAEKKDRRGAWIKSSSPLHQQRFNKFVYQLRSFYDSDDDVRSCWETRKKNGRGKVSLHQNFMRAVWPSRHAHIHRSKTLTSSATTTCITRKCIWKLFMEASRLKLSGWILLFVTSRKCKTFSGN